MVDWLTLDPHEVEWLVNNVYDRLGFNSVLTSLSKDGGVDVFANYFDQATKNYSKYVIQVKRWKKPLGVPSVRELLGVKEDQKAAKAVIVSISGYTKAANEFAFRHDLQLIDKDGFEEMLEKAQLLKTDGSLSSPSDPNLPQNRKRFVLQLLLESRPKGLLRNDIIKNIFSPRFRVTVKEGILNQDIDELSSRGEIIEEEGKYFSKIPDDEVRRISESLLSDIESLTQVFTEKDVYQLLEKQYKVPLPTAMRLISVQEVINQLLLAGKITQIVDGVFIPPRSLARIRRFDWTRESLKKSFLCLLRLPNELLENNMEEIRVKMKLPLGGATEFFNRKPLEEIPFMAILLHFCKDVEKGFLGGVLIMPLFINPIHAMTPKEMEHVGLKISEEQMETRRQHKRKSKGEERHIIARTGVRIEAIELFEEKARQICQYGSELIDLMKSLKLDKEFSLGSRGSDIAIIAICEFKRKEKLRNCLNRLLDKAEILQKFLIQVYEQCPPPIP